MPRKKKQSNLDEEIQKQAEEALKAEEDAKKEKKRQIELRKFLIPTLRRASYRWKPRTECNKDARVERGVYECAMCNGHFKNKEIVIDHVDPVVDVEKGWVDWNEFVDRMFCEQEGFQVLCKTCHGVKTNLEEKMRVKFRKDKKEKKKNGN